MSNIQLPETEDSGIKRNIEEWMKRNNTGRIIIESVILALHIILQSFVI